MLRFNVYERYTRPLIGLAITCVGIAGIVVCLRGGADCTDFIRTTLLGVVYTIWGVSDAS